jgi:hypothetical protein
MADWMNPWILAAVVLLFAAWLLYDAMRPVKDYYVLQRHYFDRIYEPPWRGRQSSAHYHGWDTYLAAKAAFDLHEGEYMRVLDGAQQEAEHSLFMVPAKSKSAAIARLKTGNAPGKELLHKTPYDDIVKRRTYWKKIAMESV